MSNKNTPSKVRALVSHFLDKYWHKPTTNGVIESSIGDRSGKAFKGRCYRGDGTASINLEAYTGDVTATVKWLKDTNGVHEDSLQYAEYIDEKGKIPLDVTAPNLHIAGTSTEEKHALRTNGDGSLVPTTTRRFIFSVRVKPVHYERVCISSPGTAIGRVLYDLNNGTILKVNSYHTYDVQGTIIPSSDGFYTLTFEYNTITLSTHIHYNLALGISGYPNSFDHSVNDDLYGVTFTGDDVSGVLVDPSYNFFNSTDGYSIPHSTGVVHYDKIVATIEGTSTTLAHGSSLPKTLTLPVDTKIHGLTIKQNELVVGHYNCEEGAGSTLFDSSGNGNSLTVVNYNEEMWHEEDSDVPYSYLNEEGYSLGKSVDFETLEEATLYDNIVDLTEADTVGVSLKQIRWGGSLFNTWLRNLWTGNEYTDLDGNPYQAGVTPHSNMAGFYDDGDGRGYYAVVYSGIGNDAINFRDMGAGITSAEYAIKLWSENGAQLKLRNNTYSNDMGRYLHEIFGVSGDSTAPHYGEGSSILVVEGTSYTYNSFKAWYDYLKALGREDEVDTRVMKYWPGFTFDDHYAAAVAKWGGVIPNSGSGARTFYAWQLQRITTYPAGHQTITDDDMVCTLGTSINNNNAAFIEGRTMGEVDYVAVGAYPVNGKVKMYTKGLGVYNKDLIPLGVNNSTPRDRIGKVRLNAQLVKSNCLDLNASLLQGVDISSLGLSIQEGKSYSYMGIMANAGDYHNFLVNNTNNNTYFKFNGSNLYSRLGAGVGVSVPVSDEVLDGDVFKLEYSIDVLDFTTPSNTTITASLTNFTRDTDKEYTISGFDGGSISAMNLGGIFTAINQNNGTLSDNTSGKRFNVVIDTYTFPLAEGSGTHVYGYELDNYDSYLTASLLNKTTDVWGKQDVYHFNAVEGLWETEMVIDESDAFITLFDTTISGASANNQVELPLLDTTTDMIVDWGDGTVEHISDYTNNTHTYSTEGSKVIKITGNYRLGFKNSGDKAKLLDVYQWGNDFVMVQGAFYGCENLTIVNSNDVPRIIETGYRLFLECTNLISINNFSSWDFSGVTSLFQMFATCTKLDMNVNGIDVSGVTNFDQLFYGCQSFTNGGNSLDWTTSAAERMSYMFYNCQVFDQPLPNFNTSKVHEFKGMFQTCYTFNQPLAHFDMSSAIGCRDMFHSTLIFNQDISDWNFTNGVISDLTNMFFEARYFNQPIGKWTLSGHTEMSNCFNDTEKFNQNLNGWDVSSVTNFQGVFANTKEFNNGSVNNDGLNPLTWDVGNGTIFHDMFVYSSKFNQYIGDWDMSSAESMYRMFGYASIFNNGAAVDAIGPALKWDVSALGDFSWTFYLAQQFNCPLTDVTGIGKWDVSNVYAMRGTFYQAYNFNQNIGDWNTEKCTTMESMFYAARSFNNGSLTDDGANPLGWNTPLCVNMNSMFYDARVFNQSLNSFDTNSMNYFTSVFEVAYKYNNGSITDDNANPLTWTTNNAISFSRTFYGASHFNQEVSTFDFSDVTYAVDMFRNTNTFNQDISSWDFSKITDMTDFGLNSGISAVNYGKLLASLASQMLQSEVKLGMGAIKYPEINQADRDVLTGAPSTTTGPYEWDITDGGVTNELADAFVATFDTTNPGSDNDTLELPITNMVGDVTVSWGDGNYELFNGTSSVAHTYASTGSKAVRVWGNYDWAFNDAGDKEKIVSVDQWGTDFSIIAGSFHGCTNLTLDSVVGVPNIVNVSQWVRDCHSITTINNLDSWDFTACVTLHYMFYSLENFNQNLNDVDFQNKTAAYFVINCRKFNNGSLTNDGLNSLNWNIKIGKYGFNGCIEFNQNVDNVLFGTDLFRTFSGTYVFNNGSITDDGANPLILNTNGSSITNARDLFAGAKEFNQNVNALDVSLCTNFESTFHLCKKFNNGVSILTPTSNPLTWNTTEALTTESMFSLNEVFDQELPNFYLNKNINASLMFNNALVFNQNIDHFGLSICENTSHMFKYASSFNNGANTNNGVNPMTWGLPVCDDANSMFEGATSFNQNVSSFGLQSCQFMHEMFKGAVLFNNGSITNDSLNALKWDISNVLSLNHTFNTTSFNQELVHTDNVSAWQTPELINTISTFANCPFNQDLSGWDTADITDMYNMFGGNTAFNQDLSSWNLSSVERLDGMFRSATSFNNGSSTNDGLKPLSWTLSNLCENMNDMFQYASAFNQNISSWDVSGVTDMSFMFNSATAFNNGSTTDNAANSLTWTTSSLENCRYMFRNAPVFNQSLENWDTSGVINGDGSGMFYGANTFNQPVSHLDVSGFTSLFRMFYSANAFNQPLTSWNTSNVKNFNEMLYGASSFNQDLHLLDYSSVENASGNGNTASGMGSFYWANPAPQMTVARYGLLLERLANQITAGDITNTGIEFEFELQYPTSSQTHRDILTNSPKNWTVNDLGSIQ